MLRLKHILMATDFCRISTAALSHALGIAKRCHSTVSILHVINPPFFDMTREDLSTALDCAEREAKKLTKQLESEGLVAGLSVDVAITVGPVWPTIANVLAEKNSGLLVLGTHGRSGLGKFVLGSVAESAFREAPCPVLTVGPMAATCRTSGGAAKHLLVPTDLSPESTYALRYGLSLARATGGDVTLLHVLKLRKKATGEGASQAALVKGRLDQFLSEHPDAATMVVARVEFGDPARLIVRVAEQSGADLIVMGVRAWSAEGPPMWQTAYNVLLQAHCPVVSMKVPLVSANEP